MIVYLDILFFINLIMNYIVLILTSSFGCIYTKRYRIFLGACFGALYAVISFVYGLNNDMIIKIIIGFLIVGVSFGKKDIFKRCVLFFLVSFAVAGAIIAIFYFSKNPTYMLINGVPYIEISINILISTYILCYVGLCLIYKGLGKNKIISDNIEQITIKIGENKTKISVFKDSGNNLFDNLTGKPVIVVENNSLYQIIPKELRFILEKQPLDAIYLASNIENTLKLRIINYKAIGTKSAIMTIFTPDEILDKKGNKINGVIGVSFESIKLAGCTAIMGV